MREDGYICLLQLGNMIRMEICKTTDYLLYGYKKPQQMAEVFIREFLPDTEAQCIHIEYCASLDQSVGILEKLWHRNRISQHLIKREHRYSGTEEAMWFSFGNPARVKEGLDKMREEMGYE